MASEAATQDAEWLTPKLTNVFEIIDPAPARPLPTTGTQAIRASFAEGDGEPVRDRATIGAADAPTQ